MQQNESGRVPEYFLEQVMEGLSDACMLLDGGDRLLYVNGTAKHMLQPKGRILGRRLYSILADRQLSTLAADAYHTGKPMFSELTLQLPGPRWRDHQHFHVSVVPLWITNTRRLVRIALREVSTQHSGNENHNATADKPQTCGETFLQMRNPLTILHGYIENLLDGLINDPAILRQSLLTMRKHTLAMERLLESCK